MPFVEVMLWEGRTVEQKRELTTAITDSVVKIAKVPRESVIIAFTDYRRSDWAEGGYLASDKIMHS